MSNRKKWYFKKHGLTKKYAQLLEERLCYYETYNGFCGVNFDESIEKTLKKFMRVKNFLKRKPEIVNHVDLAFDEMVESMGNQENKKEDAFVRTSLPQPKEIPFSVR